MIRDSRDNRLSRITIITIITIKMITLDKLILQLSKMPRVSRRAAGRMAISLLSDRVRANELLSALDTAIQKVGQCKICNSLAEGDVCEYCIDAGRTGTLCVVRDFSDVLVMEKAGVFRGRYHVIGGLLSGANGITPEDLHIWNIGDRVRDEGIAEIVFALPNTMEGKTTQSYIVAKLEGVEVLFSELASGVPMGGDLDYIDDGTLSIAFGGRKKIN